MDDKELLDFVEQQLFSVMLIGCSIEHHVGYKEYDPGSWRVGLNAEQVARLLDLAKGQNI